MKIKTIPKKSGGVRTIYVQGPREKQKYRLLGYQMAEFHKHNEVIINNNPVCHGFIEGRSPISNAAAHIGKTYSLSVDLKDFFDTITPIHLERAGVEQVLANDVCYLGTAKQGLSSSPPSSNVVGIILDKEIAAVLNNITYTRYADDLTFSSDNLADLIVLRDRLPNLIERCGFCINNKKTRIQSSNFGRRIITGVAVDDKLYPTKEQKRRLRAGRHNVIKVLKTLEFVRWTGHFVLYSVLLELHRKTFARFLGLREWCKLQLPTVSYEGKLIKTFVIHETKRAFTE